MILSFSVFPLLLSSLLRASEAFDVHHPCFSFSSSSVSRYRSLLHVRQINEDCAEKIILDDEHRNTHTSLNNGRRHFLTSTLATASLLIASPSTVSAAGESDYNSLEDIKVGGKWVSVKQQKEQNSNNGEIGDSSNDLLENISYKGIPSYFSVYLSRILINYDPAAREWWDSKLNEYSLLPSAEIRSRLGKDFGGFAASVDDGVRQFVRQSAFDRKDTAVRDVDFELFGEYLMNIYESESVDTSRQIGILLAFLPEQLQPFATLSRLEDKLRKRAEGRKDVESLRRSPTTLPVGFVENERNLLPESFLFAKESSSSKKFDVVPSIPLWEIGIDEEFGQSAVGTVFGPMATMSLSRRTPNVGFDVYKLLAFSGAAACAITHSVVIPLDVVKTRLQTDPSNYKGFIDGMTKISRDEGPKALLLGSQATIAGFVWYGLSVYPCYDLFKKILSELIAPEVLTVHTNDIALIAGALASVVASIGLAPMETCRIRTVAQPSVYCPLGLFGTFTSIANEDSAIGWRALYAGFSSILTRQVIFGSIKFISFERVCDVIYSVYPFLRDTTATSLAVSLVAGGISGCLSSIVSQPADSVLTYCAKSSQSLNFFEGSRVMVQNDGMVALFRGLGSRCLWAGSIIAGQFFLYSVFREFFSVTATDLTDQFQLFVGS